jgi:hypothetical protein
MRSIYKYRLRLLLTILVIIILYTNVHAKEQKHTSEKDISKNQISNVGEHAQTEVIKEEEASDSLHSKKEKNQKKDREVEEEIVYATKPQVKKDSSNVDLEVDSEVLQKDEVEDEICHRGVCSRCALAEAPNEYCHETYYRELYTCEMPTSSNHSISTDSAQNLVTTRSYMKPCMYIETTEAEHNSFLGFEIVCIICLVISAAFLRKRQVHVWGIHTRRMDRILNS